MGRLKCAYTCTGISTTLSLLSGAIFGTPHSALVLGYKGKAAWISTEKGGISIRYEKIHGEGVKTF